MKPSICAALIVRNEEAHLPRALRSVIDIVDRVVLVDTGSTDRTLDVAHECVDGKRAELIAETYLAASEQVDGQWRITDFSKARNRALYLSEDIGCSHVLMLDADDELLTPAALRRYIYWSQIDAFGMWYQDGGSRWTIHKLWKLGLGIQYEGRVHEYPKLDGKKMAVLQDVVIRHHGDPGENQENSNLRNLRMLTASWNKDGQSPRTAFYLGNTHRDGGRLAEAIGWYRVRIAMGEHYRDEWLFAHLYLIRCLRGLKFDTEAMGVARAVLALAPDWCEFHMELAQERYDHGKHEEAIRLAQGCVEAGIPHTELWREVNCYRDRPARLISWCYEHLGQKSDALIWSSIAKRNIGGPDKEWDGRHNRLEKEVLATKIVRPAKVYPPRVALVRPGAIGDILMTLNLIPAFKRANQEHEIHYFCAEHLGKPDALGTIIKQAGVDQVYSIGTGRPYSIDDKNNKREYERVINLIGYPLHQGYPDRPMFQHLISYFATEMGLDPMADYTLSLPRPEVRENDLWIADKPYATWQHKAGWSKMKEWRAYRKATTVKNWTDVFEHLPFPVFVIEEGVRTLHDSIALFANAKMHIGIDSWTNHATHFLWTDEDMNSRRVPGVILFGSTSPVGSGYAHNTNIWKGLHCSPCYREDPKISRMSRGPCTNPGRATYEDDTPWACMDQINITEVVDAVKAMWEKVK